MREFINDENTFLDHFWSRLFFLFVLLILFYFNCMQPLFSIKINVLGTKDLIKIKQRPT